MWRPPRSHQVKNRRAYGDLSSCRFSTLASARIGLLYLSCIDQERARVDPTASIAFN
jgi:hypothetical protein